jgi:hypothetical protein
MLRAVRQLHQARMAMDPGFVLNLAILLVVLVAIGVGFRFLIPVVARHFKGSGGWDRLAKAYATTRQPPKLLLRRQNLVVGQIVYRRSMTVGWDDAGLYLELGFPLSIFERRRLFLPWTEFKRVEDARLFWRKGALLSLGKPLIGTITVPIELFDNAIRPAIGKVAAGLAETAR